MKTKEEIAKYCVDTQGDKELAEQVVKQFERLGDFNKNDLLYRGFSLATYIGISTRGDITNGYHPDKSILFHKDTKATTLDHLTSMIDEYLGEDEYAAVRRFIEWFYRRIPDHEELKSRLLKNFIKQDKTYTPTLDELKASYAKEHGISVKQIKEK